MTQAAGGCNRLLARVRLTTSMTRQAGRLLNCLPQAGYGVSCTPEGSTSQLIPGEPLLLTTATGWEQYVHTATFPALLPKPVPACPLEMDRRAQVQIGACCISRDSYGTRRAISTTSCSGNTVQPRGVG